MTTRPTIEADKAASSVLGAAEWNVNCLQQGRWSQEVIAGTNSDKIPGAACASPLNLPGRLTIDNDANFLLYRSAPYSIIQFDTGGDQFLYDRTANIYYWQVAGTSVLTLNGTGKLGGTGFYDSGDVSVANTGLPVTFNTSFSNGGGGAAGEGPMLVWAIYGTTAGVDINNPIGPATTVSFGTCTNTVVNIINNAAGSRVVRVFALTNA